MGGELWGCCGGGGGGGCSHCRLASLCYTGGNASPMCVKGRMQLLCVCVCPCWVVCVSVFVCECVCVCVCVGGGSFRLLLSTFLAGDI